MHSVIGFTQLVRTSSQKSNLSIEDPVKASITLDLSLPWPAYALIKLLDPRQLLCTLGHSPEQCTPHFSEQLMTNHQTHGHYLHHISTVHCLHGDFLPHHVIKCQHFMHHQDPAQIASA
jgi:hypothetical protein